MYIYLSTDKWKKWIDKWLETDSRQMKRRWKAGEGMGEEEDKKRGEWKGHKWKGRTESQGEGKRGKDRSKEGRRGKRGNGGGKEREGEKGREKKRREIRGREKRYVTWLQLLSTPSMTHIKLCVLICTVSAVWVLLSVGQRLVIKATNSQRSN